MTELNYSITRAGTSDAEDLRTPISLSGLFSADEAEGFLESLPDMLADPAALWLRLDGSRSIAGACYATRDGMSDDVWNLWFIGLVPEERGRGGGQLLLQVAEAEVRAHGARILIIETSSDPDQAPARRFYAAAGYVQQGAIGDYYAPGISKVIFAKPL